MAGLGGGYKYIAILTFNNMTMKSQSTILVDEGTKVVFIF